MVGEQFFRVIPLLKEEVALEPETVNRLLEWCKIMWPKADWDQFRMQDPVQTTLSAFINPQISSKLMLYPNPVRNGQVSLSSPQTIKFVRISDMDGKLILETAVNGTNIDLELPNLSEGMYLLTADQVEAGIDKISKTMIKFMIK